MPTLNSHSPVKTSQVHGGADAQDCNALRVRIGGCVDAELLAERLALLTWQSRLWVERVPVSSGEPAAVRRREREMATPVDAERGVRAVLIEYADGQADLVLVAHRSVSAGRSLRKLARALLGGHPYEPIMLGTDAGTPGPETGERAGPDFTGSPTWGLGDRRYGEQPAEHRIALPEGPVGDPASWLAALAVVLSRYEAREHPVVAALGAGQGWGIAVLQAEITELTTLGDLASEFRARLDAGPVPSPAQPAVDVGLVFDFGEDEPGMVSEYVPFLAPLFPLTIEFRRGADDSEDGNPSTLWCRYRPASVSPAIAAQFARHLIHVHGQVVGSPGLLAVNADLLDEAEVERVLALGLPPRTLESTPRRLHDVFADRAAERPDAVALSDDDRQVSYGELDRWSNRLAHGLRAAGMRDGDLVGVCAERSAELVAILLAVLKAGGVYVPMDPAYPAERLAYQVEDSGMRVLVTTLPGFPASAELHVVTPAQIAELGARGSDSPPVSDVTPADPAYVIYTSGSTGRPKGVLVPHANVISLLDATRADFALGAEDVWTFFHSVAFDFSVWEIWGCLLTGGHLVVVPYWLSRSPEQFRDLLVARNVTVLNQTPSGFTQLMEADRSRRERLPVRLVIFGGEPLDTRALLPWLDRYPESRCRLVNMFGITETTVHVTAETISRQMALAASKSVGTPVPGWHVYVLDPAGRPVPPGATGEICVGGAGVALGYLRRPELTGERFVPDPFADGRIYRSGDRGRMRPDGKLEHLGRIDNQVKLRGFRIELDEIRSVLAESPGVVAAAVVLRQEDPADAATGRLDAYVVLSEGSAPQLRQHLARMLPDYMLPATITPLPTFPLTTNGKVDLENLPAPIMLGSGANDDDVPQEGDHIADGLLDVWRQVFGSPVSMHDDFFELGGNSLLAVRMAAAMRERGLPALNPRTLYLNSTVRELADALRS